MDYLIGIIAIAVVGLSVYKFVKDIKTGKNDCGCNCKNCSSNNHCNINK